MNWMRGLVRLWVVLSLLWIGWVVLAFQPWAGFMVEPSVATAAGAVSPEDNRFAKYLDDGSPALSQEQADALNRAKVRRATDEAWKVTLLAILPPVGLLTLLLAGVWVASGFRREGEL